MKLTLIALLLGLSQFINAANFGKFEFKMGSDYQDDELIVFLLNTSGDITVIQDENYYEVEKSFFFGELSLTLTSGGDEQYTITSYTMVDNKLIEACTILVDGPNGYVSKMSDSYYGLNRWNKFAKKYEAVPNLQSVSTKEACFSRLLENFDDFEVLEL